EFFTRCNAGAVGEVPPRHGLTVFRLKLQDFEAGILAAPDAKHAPVHCNRSRRFVGMWHFDSYARSENLADAFSEARYGARPRVERSDTVVNAGCGLRPIDVTVKFLQDRSQSSSGMILRMRRQLVFNNAANG